MYSNERIVVTGVGVVTSIGKNSEEFFNNAVNGTVSISDVQTLDVSEMRHHRGGEIHDFNITDHFPDNPELHEIGRAKQFAMTAAKECLDCNQTLEQVDSFRIGVALGFTQGESKALEDFSEAYTEGNLEGGLQSFKDYPPKLLSQSLASHFKLYGPNFIIGQACSAGNFCAGIALDALHSGEVDAVLTGGTDAFSRYCYAGFSRLGAIAEDTPRPFSLNRTGMVPAEGAGMLLLETLSSAQKRGAKIYAEIVGYGESADAHHITQPSANGIEQAMRMALNSANLSPDAIDYVSVHGTGTNASDKTESTVLNSIYPDKKPPLSSIKSLIGHTMGAASSIECVASIYALNNQILPPTMSFLEDDPECQVDCIPNQARKTKVNYVMKTASAFGGQNAVVIFKKWNEQEENNNAA